LAAVKVYVVVEVGATPTLVPVTAPTPESMVSAVAPLTFQVKIADPPGGTLLGLAVNDAMVGAAMHDPEAHARPTPHAVASAFAPVSVQVPGAVGDTQAIAPVRHGFGG
jgi:hypothetical protein